MTYIPKQRLTVSNLPSASLYVGKTVIVTDEVGGEGTAISDGANWRRTADNRIAQAFPLTVIINGQSNAAAVPEGTLGSSRTENHLGADILAWGETAGAFVQMVDGHASAKSTLGPGGGAMGSLLLRRLADATGQTVRAYTLAYTSQAISYFEPGSATNAFFGDNS